MRQRLSTVMQVIRAIGSTRPDTAYGKRTSRTERRLSPYWRIAGLVVLCLYGCIPGRCVSPPVQYEDAYHGQIISAETGEPLEGVVVLATWDVLVSMHPAGTSSRFYDARETVTNAQGEFTIPALGLKFFTPLEGMRLWVFKAGFEYFDYPWITYKKGGSTLNPARFEGDKLILPLKQLTIAERKQIGSMLRPSMPLKLMPNLMCEINKDRIERGLDPF